MERRRTCAVLLLLLLPFLSCVGQCEAQNILVIDAVPSPSHQIWMRALSSALGNSGYNVTLLTMPTIGNVQQENVHPLFMPELWEWTQSDMDIDILEMANMGSYVKMFAFLTFYDPQNQRALNSTGYKALLNYPKDFRFDLIIYDYLSAYALLSLKEFFNDPPLVAVSPYPGIGVTNLMTRGPDFPSFVPHMLKDEVEDCFWDRLESFLVSSIYNFLEQYYILPVATKAVRKILPTQVQTMNEILLSATIQLANYHPAIDCVHPIMPSVIPVGGLQIAEPKPLPKDLEEIYSMKSKGNVLFSLGSNVKSEDLGIERLNELIGALEELPDYNFIWKIDLKGLDLKMPKNVFIKKWLPQNDMLADKRTVLFMSHAGGLSTQECTWYGVPMLALPVMFDQFPNSERVVKVGMGLKVDIRYLKKEELKASLLELLTDKKYSEKAQQLSRNFRDQPERPIERALWWIEYVLRNPDVSFLKNKKLLEMNYIAKHSIDVIAFLTVIILVILLLIIKIIFCLIRKKNRKQKVKKH